MNRLASLGGREFESPCQLASKSARRRADVAGFDPTTAYGERSEPFRSTERSEVEVVFPHVFADGGSRSERSERGNPRL